MQNARCFVVLKQHSRSENRFRLIRAGSFCKRAT